MEDRKPHAEDIVCDNGERQTIGRESKTFGAWEFLICECDRLPACGAQPPNLVVDDDQSVADAFGATHTPQFFLFDKERKLRYSGKFDDNWKEPGAVKERYLQDALEAVLSGAQVPVPETHSIGCTIKWK